jgi:predicted ATPase
MAGRLLTRIGVRNYKSIPACDVQPAQLCFLVGPNGSGKSNFMDALRFVTDSLRFSLDHALRERGGINEVRRRSSGHPNHFGIRLEFSLADARGYYAFHIGAGQQGKYWIKQEECRILPRAGSGDPAFYEIMDGELARSTLTHAPSVSRDRLYLVSLSGTPAFRPVADALSNMGFYNLNPDQIRDLQSPDPGDLLRRDGSNLASVFANLAARAPELKARVEEYLGKVVPGISGVEAVPVGPKQTLQFRQEVRGAEHPWKFFANGMSDGTLRALGVLVASFQGAGNGDSVRRLIGIEEPEAALHPAAAGVLFDSLQDASDQAQILVTSHSADLLDVQTLPDESILAVTAEHGETRIGPLDEAGRSALRDHLYTAGELLRMDQLRPDPKRVLSHPDQLDLFGSPV